MLDEDIHFLKTKYLKSSWLISTEIPYRDLSTRVSSESKLLDEDQKIQFLNTYCKFNLIYQFKICTTQSLRKYKIKISSESGSLFTNQHWTNN